MTRDHMRLHRHNVRESTRRASVPNRYPGTVLRLEHANDTSGTSTTGKDAFVARQTDNSREHCEPGKKASWRDRNIIIEGPRVWGSRTLRVRGGDIDTAGLEVSRNGQRIASEE